MNKKEVSEIKKQFSPENCSITRICGCYVDGEKNKKSLLKEAFLSLPEEEMFKYLDLFKKTLSGKLEKNLINMNFPLSQEREGGAQDFLLKLRNSKLKDEKLLEYFYDKIIENYDCNENYYIILAHAVYDIPGKASDGADMFDASDDVFEHILCCICPVKLSKAGLGYNVEKNRIEDRLRDWIVDMPDIGFLFPVFNDRSTDIHSILYYTKKVQNLHPVFTKEFLGCETPLSSDGQQDSFNTLVEDVLGDDCNYNTVVDIHEKLNEIIVSQKDAPEPTALSANDIKRVFEYCGVSEDKLQCFDEQYESAVGNSSLQASNITNEKNLTIKTPDVSIKVDSDRLSIIEEQIISGRRCLVIPIEGFMELNGLAIN